MSEEQKNWAGNYIYSTNQWHFPQTVSEVQAIVSACEQVRAVGSRHSFNGIADSTENMLSLSQLAPIIEIDEARQTVTVSGGMRYGDFCDQLHEAGYALHNLASLPHISVVGACATATHGSGEGNGNLATAVSALELVTANGDVVTLSRDKDGDSFAGAVVHLGALGIVTKITLDIQPTYQVRQDVFENLALADFVSSSEQILGAAYSVSLFTKWQNGMFDQLWLKRRVTAEPQDLPAELFGATAAPTHRHPIRDVSPENCTQQMGIAAPWHDRLPHFRMGFTPSDGDELQSEYFVPRSQAVGAVQAVMSLGEQVAPLLHTSEVRTVAADDLWLSPCYEQDSVGLHFTWRPKETAVRQILPLLEEKLAPFEACPHWGKLFVMTPQRVQTFYPRLPDFRDLVHQYDPNGKFRNAYVNAMIFDAD